MPFVHGGAAQLTALFNRTILGNFALKSIPGWKNWYATNGSFRFKENDILHSRLKNTWYVVDATQNAATAPEGKDDSYSVRRYFPKTRTFAETPLLLSKAYIEGSFARVGQNFPEPAPEIRDLENL